LFQQQRIWQDMSGLDVVGIELNITPRNTLGSPDEVADVNVLMDYVMKWRA
jgi:hypothetical protein